MREGQFLHPVHVGPVFFHRQRLFKKQPCAGIPVVRRQKQIALGHIYHRRTRRVTGTGDDLRCQAAKLHRAWINALRQWNGCIKEVSRNVNPFVHSLFHHPLTLISG